MTRIDIGKKFTRNLVVIQHFQDIFGFLDTMPVQGGLFDYRIGFLVCSRRSSGLAFILHKTFNKTLVLDP